MAGSPSRVSCLVLTVLSAREARAVLDSGNPVCRGGTIQPSTPDASDPATDELRRADRSGAVYEMIPKVLQHGIAHLVALPSA
jgi:hypothetical protein